MARRPPLYRAADFHLLTLGLLLTLYAKPAQASEIPALPNAPSSTLALASSSFTPIASDSRNLRPYQKPTRLEDLIAYRRELIGPRPFLAAAVRSGIEQARAVPVGWGQDFPGYLQRYGSAYAESAIDSTVRFSLAAVFHEDVRYLPCHSCSFGAKFQNAVLAECTARHGGDGHRTLSATPIVAGFTGPLVAYNAWYPPSYTSAQAARHASLGFTTRIAFHLIREFLFDKHP